MTARLSTLVAAITASAVVADYFQWNPNFFTPMPPYGFTSFFMDPLASDVLVGTYRDGPGVVSIDLTNPKQ